MTAFAKQQYLQPLTLEEMMNIDGGNGPTPVGAPLPPPPPTTTPTQPNWGSPQGPLYPDNSAGPGNISVSNPVPIRISTGSGGGSSHPSGWLIEMPCWETFKNLIGG